MFAAFRFSLHLLCLHLLLTQMLSNGKKASVSSFSSRPARFRWERGNRIWQRYCQLRSHISWRRWWYRDRGERKKLRILDGERRWCSHVWRCGTFPGKIGGAGVISAWNILTDLTASWLLFFKKRTNRRLKSAIISRGEYMMQIYDPKCGKIQ